MRRPILTAIALFALAAPGLSQAPPPRIVRVELTSFDFTPRTIVIAANAPVTLTLVNRSNGGHDFAAPAFFAAARVAPGDSGKIVKGRVEVPKGGEVTIRLTAPTAGRYPLKCSHFMHSTFGMTGEIVVG